MVKSKILFILHLPAPIHGAAMVGKFIKESKIVNSIFCADYINLSTTTNLINLRKGGAKKLLSVLKIQYKVLKALINKQYDLFYITLTATGPGFYKDLFVVALLKLFRKRIIYHFHNKGISTRQQNKLDNLLYRFAFNNTKSILLSPYLYFDIKKYVSKKDVFFCANGIPDIKKYLGEEPEHLYKPCKLLFLSNMMGEKGIIILLRACQLLKAKGLKFECHFVGAWTDISQKVFDEITLDMGITDCSFAHGKKYNEEKSEFFLGSDIFVFPTFYHNEAFPLVILEAMQFELPVISTFEGGIPDIVVDGETGFLVPQKDAEALAYKIEVLIQNPTLRVQMGKHGRKRYEALFTLEKFEENLVSILHKVTAN